MKSIEVEQGREQAGREKEDSGAESVSAGSAQHTHAAEPCQLKFVTFRRLQSNKKREKKEVEAKERKQNGENNQLNY